VIQASHEARPLLSEIGDVLAGVPAEALDSMAAAIAAARRLALYGQGRTGLVMQAFAMRLHHLGLAAHVVGAMNAEPLGPGDLFLVNAATGDLPTGLALMRSARAAGASTGLFTGVTDSEAGRLANVIVPIPAPMGGQQGRHAGLVMGSAYELALFVVTELLVARLMHRLGVSEADMWARHANLL
jgi:6-phospho-3-hexuloisomerase